MVSLLELDAVSAGAAPEREAVLFPGMAVDVSASTGFVVRGGESSVSCAWEELEEAVGGLCRAVAELDPVRSRSRALFLRAVAWGVLDEEATVLLGGFCPELLELERARARCEDALRQVSAASDRAGEGLGDLERRVRRAKALYEEAENTAVRSMRAAVPEGFSISRDQVQDVLGSVHGLPGAVGLLAAGLGVRDRQRPVAVMGRAEVTERRPPVKDGAAGYLTDGLALVKRLAIPWEGREHSAILVETITVPGEADTMVVYLPGSADLSDIGSDNPNGFIGLGDALYGRSEAMRSGVEGALRAAGHRPGTTVILAGHSQGGMHAANLAGDREFVSAYSVRGLYTVGSPTGATRLDPRVDALQVENSGDVIPGLEGAANRATARRVTVTAPRESPDRLNVEQGGFPVEHGLDQYAATAAEVDRVRDQPSIIQARDRLGAWLRPESADASRRMTVFEVGQNRDAAPPHREWHWGVSPAPR